MTSFYMFRLWFLTFFGEYRGPNPETAGHGHDADAQHAGHAERHDAQDAHARWQPRTRRSAREPLGDGCAAVILALLSFVGGWVGVPHSLHGSDRVRTIPRRPYCSQSRPAASRRDFRGEARGRGEQHHRTDFQLSSRSRLPLLGFVLAWYLYYKRPDLPAKMAKGFGGLYTLVLNKYKIDELYGAVIIQPLISLSTNVFWKGIDKRSDRWRGRRQRRRSAGNFRRDAADAVRQHPLLRRMGCRGGDRRNCLHGVEGLR